MNTNPESSSSSKKNRSKESLFERMFVSVVTFMIFVMLCKLWYEHREQLLQKLVQDEEYRAYVKERMNGVWQISLFFTISFLLKGYNRPADKRKGSARLQYNYALNVGFAIAIGFSVIVISEAIYIQGYIGLITRTILLFLFMWYFVEVRMMQKCCEFIHNQCVRVGDIMDFIHNIDREFPITSRYRVVDIHLKGIGGVICVDENNGQIVNIPSTSSFRAWLQGSRDEYV